MTRPLPPEGLPTVTLSIEEVAAAKRNGTLTIHDNGVLTIGDPPVQVHTPKKDRRRKKLTCSDLCDKTWEFQGCPSGTCALNDSRKRRKRLTENGSTRNLRTEYNSSTT
jgi:hypothetical protein